MDLDVWRRRHNPYDVNMAERAVNKIPKEWLEEFEAAARRPLELPSRQPISLRSDNEKTTGGAIVTLCSKPPAPTITVVPPLRVAHMQVSITFPAPVQTVRGRAATYTLVADIGDVNGNEVSRTATIIALP